ncbi:MAG TPA: ADP-forming succinate--CoA ligase subunit beta [Syntrophorhabdaceae bacterium]|nr:ADP-forming succinate--CoA ligase subunit beta [Syntrophorhabdaceae bacterium]
MKIHEYQAKKLLDAYGLRVPRGAAANSPEEAFRIAQQIGQGPYAVKAQIHAGGRGRAHGIETVEKADDVRGVARRMLGGTLATDQTGACGKPVQMLLIEEAIDAQKELYLGIVVDRESACPVVLMSAQGGVDIETTAGTNPEKLVRETIDPQIGLRPFQVNRIIYALGIDQGLSGVTGRTIMNLYRLFIEKDCSLAEINPLAITKNGELVALDAKLNFDDNALYRQGDIQGLRDVNQENPLEVEASKYHLNYIKMNGSVGCMVNGAGLAMATMDLISLVGAEPANFLDVGGGATSEMVKQGLKILLYDKDVKMIFINIFGGILRCDVLAEGIVKAAREMIIDLPIVVRLEGTNVEAGRNILSGSGLSLTVAKDLREAAARIGEIVRSIG